MQKTFLFLWTLFVMSGDFKINAYFSKNAGLIWIMVTVAADKPTKLRAEVKLPNFRCQRGLSSLDLRFKEQMGGVDEIGVLSLNQSWQSIHVEAERPNSGWRVTESVWRLKTFFVFFKQMVPYSCFPSLG